MFYPPVKVLPTHVGMSQVGDPYSQGVPCAPHTRGDEPPPPHASAHRFPCSPHTWG